MDVVEVVFVVFGKENFFVVLVEVGEDFFGVQVFDDCVDWYVQDDVFVVSVVLVGVVVVFVVFVDKFLGVVVVDQCVDVVVVDNVDIVVVFIVIIVWVVYWDVFFVVECSCVIVVVIGFYINFGFVYEFYVLFLYLLGILLLENW